MDYKKMYYSLFNSVSDVILELDKEENRSVSNTLKKVQIDAEDLYLNLSKNTGRTFDILKAKKALNGKVG